MFDPIVGSPEQDTRALLSKTTWIKYLGGIPEYIKNNRTGLVFSVGDENALAKLLLFSIKDKKEVERIKKIAKIKISKKTWGAFSDIYLKIYKNLSEEYQYKPFKPWTSFTKKMWIELTNGR